MRLALLSLVALVPAARADEIDPEDLKPGLVAAHADDSGATIIARLEPFPALNLGDGEAPHPALNAAGDSTWSGYLSAFRNGKYRFDAFVLGKVAVTVGGKAAFSGQSAKGEVLTGKPFELASGVHAIVVQFDRPKGPARLELFWQAPGLPREPLPGLVLGHLPKERKGELAANTRLDHGRFVFEERACVKCHKPAADDKMALGLAERKGPNLAGVGGRAYAGWLDAWLADPRKLRPDTAMPKAFADDAAGRDERFAVLNYLVSLGGPLPDAKAVPPKDAAVSFARGQTAFSTSGCTACHQKDDKAREAPNNFYALAFDAPAKYELGGVGSKWPADKLAAYLQNPHATAPFGRMPAMQLAGTEAADLARFLAAKKEPGVAPEFPSRGQDEPSAAIEKLVADKDKAGYGKLTPAKKWQAVGERLVIAKGCVNCHDIPAPGGKTLLPPSAPAPALADIKAKPDAGCLHEKPDAGKHPVYDLTAVDREAVRAFLKAGLTGAGSKATSFDTPHRLPPLQLPELPPARRRRGHVAGVDRIDAEAGQGRERRRRSAAGADRRRPQTADAVAQRRAGQFGPVAAMDEPANAAVRPAERRLPRRIARPHRGGRAGEQESRGQADGREGRGRPAHDGQDRAGLHLVPRHGRHPELRHARPRPGHDHAAGPHRLVPALAGGAAADGPRHAHAAGVHRRQIDPANRPQGGRRGPDGSVLGVLLARPERLPLPVGIERRRARTRSC